MRIFVIEVRRKIVVRAKLGFATSGVVGIYAADNRRTQAQEEKPAVELAKPRG